MKTCAFFGRRRFVLLDYDILCDVVERLINDFGITEFLVGTHGYFDEIAFGACLRMKKKYPNIEINKVITSPRYPDKHCEGGIAGDNYHPDYNFISYPVEDLYFKVRIIETNKYMIKNSDIIVAYADELDHVSGATRAVKFARLRNKYVINLINNDKTIAEYQLDMVKKEINILNNPPKISAELEARTRPIIEQYAKRKKVKF